MYNQAFLTVHSSMVVVHLDSSPPHLFNARGGARVDIVLDEGRVYQRRVIVEHLRNHKNGSCPMKQGERATPSFLHTRVLLKYCTRCRSFVSTFNFYKLNAAASQQQAFVLLAQVLATTTFTTHSGGSSPHHAHRQTLLLCFPEFCCPRCCRSFFDRDMI